MSRLDLTIECGLYDRTEALTDGTVRPEGIALAFRPLTSPIANPAADIAEMTLARYLALKSRGDVPYIAIPIFPLRRFPHGEIFVARSAGIAEPKDLAGKRVGRQADETAAPWIEGMLRHEYGVDRLTVVENGDAAMLDTGKIDAYLGADAVEALRRAPDRIARLFPDPRTAAREWLERTRVFPIMTVLVMRDSLHARYPWIAESLFKAFDEAKRWCVGEMRFSGALRYMLPWLLDEVDEMDALFGRDPFPYGLEPNHAALEMLARFLAEQSTVPAGLAIEKLFTPIVAWAE